jgi:hypothetical protein
MPGCECKGACSPEHRKIIRRQLHSSVFKRLRGTKKAGFGKQVVLLDSPGGNRLRLLAEFARITRRREPA